MSNVKAHVEQIIKDLENGIIITKDDVEAGYYEEMYQEGDIVSGHDYLMDILDIEYITTRDKQYKGARILVAFGGPNIWINTLTKEVEGYWWDDKCIMSYHADSMDLDECLEEYFNCL